VPGFKAAAPIDTMEVELSTNDPHSTSYDVIQFDTIVRDTGGWFDTTNHRWTVTSTGLYLGFVQVRYSANIAGYYDIYDYTNSQVVRNLQTYSTLSASNTPTFFWNFQQWFEAGDAYHMHLYTRASVNVLADDDTRMMLTGPIVTHGGQVIP